MAKTYQTTLKDFIEQFNLHDANLFYRPQPDGQYVFYLRLYQEVNEVDLKEQLTYRTCFSPTITLQDDAGRAFVLRGTCLQNGYGETEIRAASWDEEKKKLVLCCRTDLFACESYLIEDREIEVTEIAYEEFEAICNEAFPPPERKTYQTTLKDWANTVVPGSKLLYKPLAEEGKYVFYLSLPHRITEEGYGETPTFRICCTPDITDQKDDFGYDLDFYRSCTHNGYGNIELTRIRENEGEQDLTVRYSCGECRIKDCEIEVTEIALDEFCAVWDEAYGNS